jgi:hypothetical protein
MVRAIATRILRQILLVIVGAEAFSSTEITALSRRGHRTGRLSVDIDADPAVDLLLTLLFVSTEKQHADPPH